MIARALVVAARSVPAPAPTVGAGVFAQALLLLGPVGGAVARLEHGAGRAVAADDGEDVGPGVVEQLVAVIARQRLHVVRRGVDEGVSLGHIVLEIARAEVGSITSELIAGVLFGGVA